MADEVLAVSGWEAWHDWHAKIQGRLVDWFCEQVAGPERTVLDAACGTGLPSIAVAGRVGKVIATDVSEVMLGAARRKSAGVRNIEHRVMDIAALEFPDATFDAVTCSFGLIYCPDPVKGAAELRRVSKPGAPIALTAWDVPDKNAFFTTLFGTLGRFLKLPPPDPRAPGPFRLSAPGELAAVLSAAGFTSIDVTSEPVTYEFESVGQHWEAVSSLVAPLQNAARTLPAADLNRLKQTIADAISPYAEGGRVRFPQVALRARAHA
jgi:SAM-dependent methyltransferase